MHCTHKPRSGVVVIWLWSKCGFKWRQSAVHCIWLVEFLVGIFCGYFSRIFSGWIPIRNRSVEKSRGDYTPKSTECGQRVIQFLEIAVVDPWASTTKNLGFAGDSSHRLIHIVFCFSKKWTLIGCVESKREYHKRIWRLSLRYRGDRSIGMLAEAWSRR